MKPDLKKRAALIISFGKGKKPEPEEVEKEAPESEEESDPDKDAYMSAASDVMAALKEDDVEKFSAALKDFISACS